MFVLQASVINILIPVIRINQALVPLKMKVRENQVNFTLSARIGWDSRSGREILIPASVLI